MTRNQRLSDICMQMTLCGGGLGLVGGGILGAGFVTLTYNPFQEMNILLIMVGALATMLVGLTFGLVTGGLSGIAVTVLTTLLFKHARFQTVYKVLMAGVTVAVTVMTFVYTAHLVGRPFIYFSPTNQTWGWSLLVAIVGALVISIMTSNAYLNQQGQKAKITNTQTI